MMKSQTVQQKYRSAGCRILVLLLASCGGCTSPYSGIPEVQAENLPEGVKLTRAFSQLAFKSAVFLASVPDTDKLAVIEQAGRIKVFQNDENTASVSTVLDLSDRILSGGEQGLLGMAFDPAFTANRYLYLNYSMRKPRRNVVSRVQWNAKTDRIQPETEKIILEFEQPYSNHNGGMLAFGPDGYLYIGVGDGGSGGDPKGHGQNRNTLLGSVLRLDVHPADSSKPYAIPRDNPFTDNPCCRPEIFAYGLRNPYRFSFDSETGDLWVPDVGQNRLEEINLVENGGNYGWNIFEGNRVYTDQQSASVGDYASPVFEYDHSKGSSITGGRVYRGEKLPALLGRYLYADYVSGKVWALMLYADGNTENTELGRVPDPTSFGETGNGEILIVTHNNGLYKLHD